MSSIPRSRARGAVCRSRVSVEQHTGPPQRTVERGQVAPDITVIAAPTTAAAAVMPGVCNTPRPRRAAMHAQAGRAHAAQAERVRFHAA